MQFEQETSLEQALLNKGFKVKKNGKVFLKGQYIGIIGSKQEFEKRILKLYEIRMKDILSSKLLPDEAFLNLQNKTVYIIEKKFQNGHGSVDEKLQTCDFKRKQYKKLFKGTGIKVKYCYLCNDWFKKSKYDDVKKYIVDVKCYIFFNEIPFKFLGL